MIAPLFCTLRTSGYSGLLGTGESTPAFTDTLTIDGDIAGRVRQTSVSSGGYTTITTIYEYDGARFCVEAKVDAVQEHNAQDVKDTFLSEVRDSARAIAGMKKSSPARRRYLIVFFLIASPLLVQAQYAIVHCHPAAPCAPDHGEQRQRRRL